MKTARPRVLKCYLRILVLTQAAQSCWLLVLLPSTLRMKSALIWVPVSVAALVCFFLFMEKPGVPAPDFAVGADQNLLIDVEQALYRDCPEALAPAAALVQEIK